MGSSSARSAGSSGPSRTCARSSNMAATRRSSTGCASRMRSGPAIAGTTQPPGPHALEHQMLTVRGLLAYAAFSGVIALAIGAYLVSVRGPLALALLAAGAVAVLFYTYPLKYIGLGEVAVILVWGPLMIGGAYFVVTGLWDWDVVLVGLPYALGATTVIFGKHIDKLEDDRTRGIHTLPVLVGERAARWILGAMIVLMYAIVVYLVVIGS